jgi:glycosyltransferase involved in cell wall biosynthesis
VNSSRAGGASVCFVSPKAYPLFNPAIEATFGGAEVDVYLVATELARRGEMDVHCVVGDYGQPIEEVREGVRLHRSLRGGRNPLVGAWRVWQALVRADADVYLIKTASFGVELVRRFCAVRRRAFVYRAASRREVDGSYARTHRLGGMLFNRSLRRADLVLVQTVDQREMARRTLGIEAVVIPNPLRVEATEEVPRDRVLWVGRSSPVKRPDLLLGLAKRWPGIAFEMICPPATGDEDYESLRAEAEGIANLSFRTSVPYRSIGAHFAAARCLVSTSDSEGFPNVFLQACAAGTPIISLTVNPDGFLDETGCGVCCEGDFDRLVEVVGELWDSPRLPQMGRDGRRCVRDRHRVEDIASRYRDILVRLAAHRGGRVDAATQGEDR